MNDILSKINANERMVGIGSVIVIVSFILGIFTLRFVGFIALPCAVISLVVLFIKYSPDSKFVWPAPVPLILVILGAIATISSALWLLLAMLGTLLDLFDGDIIRIILAFIGLVLTVAVLVGSGMMLFGGYKEYSVKTA